MKYISEGHTKLTTQEIPAAYLAPTDLRSEERLDDSEPRPGMSRTEVNHALAILQLDVIPTTPSTATLLETTSSIESITTLTNQLSDLNLKRKQQSHLEGWLG